MKKTFLLICGLVLAACQPDAPPETAVSAVSPASEAAPQTDEKNTVQSFESSDGRIKIVVQSGTFADIRNQTDGFPDGLSEREITLLIRDEASNTTIYAANLGKAQTDAKTYFGNLKQSVESAAGLQDVRVGMATDNRMNYRFVQRLPDGELTESCIAIHETDLFSVCANSRTASAEELSRLLADVNLQNTLP